MRRCTRVITTPVIYLPAYRGLLERPCRFSFLPMNGLSADQSSSRTDSYSSLHTVHVRRELCPHFVWPSFRSLTCGCVFLFPITFC